MKFATSLLFVAATAAMASAQVDSAIYVGHSTSGGGAPYSGLVGFVDTPDVMFATNTGFSWHPFGLSAFGADITGILNASADGTYAFSLNSDDGSQLFIDGSLVVDDGGPHGPNLVTNSAFLTAGHHSFEVQFFEDFGGDSGVDLLLPNGVTYATPEPASFVVAGFGALCLMRRRKR
jgi:hypothetical protein